MRQDERINSPLAALRSAATALQSRIWTALPGILQSYNREAGTCTVQIAIKGTLLDRNNTRTQVDIPILEDVPVLTLGGGGYSITLPLKKGDEGLVIFACRSIDGWWQSGGVQPEAEYRMHDLSDGFFVPGFRSQSRKLSSVSDDSVVIRSDDGQRSVAIDDAVVRASVPEGNVELSAASAKLTHAAQIELNTPVIRLNGAVVFGNGYSVTSESGTIDFGGCDMNNVGQMNAQGVDGGSVTSQGKELATHTHNAPSGGGPTSPPL